MSLRKLNVIDTRTINTGVSATGKPWTLWEIVATNPDGAPVEATLKSFQRLSGNVEVEVERQDHPTYGTSYMLSTPRAGGSGARPAAPAPPVDNARLDRLEQRLDALYSVVTQLVDRQDTPLDEPAHVYGRPPEGAAQF